MHALVFDPDCLKPGMVSKNFKPNLVIPLAKSTTVMRIRNEVPLIRG